MDLKVRSQIHNCLIQRLRMKGDLAPLNDQDLLFTTGRLDSLDAVELIMTLETDYGINFSDINFDLTLLDSTAAIIALIDRQLVKT
ncbi:acyl carrier protein [Bradyrhizobium sp. S69]|uniref:acyl carrier protein n=1 Tax=Bradyrhizobium sp. S69 TaxID=1641856 RepID=UPI00131CF78E|nr:acyl carrier protein [Bradyrhizobium sp. S69]